MKLNEKLKKTMTMIVGGFILFIAIIALISRCNRERVYTIEEMGELKARLIEIARSHYRNNEDALPSEGESIVLSIQALVDAGRMSPLNRIIENGENCSGQITVMNNRGYILYLPKIDCGELYQTKRLTDVILDSENIVTTGNGLYVMNNGFVFRGETVNNHIYFANRLWVILRINTDGSIKIMEVPRRSAVAWDNRFNPERNSTSGINEFINNNINSRIRDRLESIYADDREFTDLDRAHIIPQNLCIGKRALTDTINDGSIECAQTLPNQTLGLIAVYQYLQASLDENCINTTSPSCVNFNYLANLTPAFWTITADSETSFRAFRINRNLSLINTSNTSSIKVTALLTGEALISEGDGSAEYPFILTTSQATST